MTTNKTIVFLGATGGCGLSALRRSLNAGHQCVALCRDPSKLTALLPSPTPAHLTIVEGNAFDEASLTKIVMSPSNAGVLVDAVVTSIGPAFSNSDFQTCEKGMKALLAVLATCRQNGATGNPRILAISSTGVSQLGRDIPIAVVPLYRTLIKKPHKDKRVMEELLYASNEQWTILRPSLFLGEGEKNKTIRVGIEDPVSGIESKAIGYTITKEDVGKWIFENILQANGEDRYLRKIASITY